MIAYEDISQARRPGAERDSDRRTDRLSGSENSATNAVIELCLSPKSNSSISAVDEALKDIRTGKIGDVPKHLKDAHYKI